MALSELGDEGLALWHRWSRPSVKYEPNVLDEKWAGFAVGTTVTLGTLFYLAEQAGWPGPPRRVGGVTRHRGSITISVRRRIAESKE